MRNKWLRLILQRRLVVLFLLLVQIIILIVLIDSGSKYYSIVSSVLTFISLLVSLHILTRKVKGAYKLTWIIQIMLFPVFGGLLYLIIKFQTSTRKFSSRQKRIDEETRPYYFIEDNIFSRASAAYPEYVAHLRYLENFAGFPVFDGTETEYLTPGEAKFSCMLDELKKSEKYIFLEYFIIDQGVMWDSILEILKEKAAAGVEVRVMYDDVGCFVKMPKGYPNYLRGFGIQCTVFNPFRPVLTALQNNRDHRKICVVDGKVAFTGGINLADEYINVFERFGHWKDASVVLRGKAAWSFTLMFLEMWSLANKTEEDYFSYYPWRDEPCRIPGDGYVQPYADSPMDSDNVGEHVYLQIIGSARDYIYINTPYLIVDDSMISSLILAAKSGVDVRIVTPYMPDKRLVHITTRSYYHDLVKSGVRIYEYSKGFIHSKTFVSDDKIATVGTTNLDFRSLYLHFECGVVMYGSRAVCQLKEDFLRTLELCEEITEEKCRGNVFVRFFQSLLRLFAPLM